MRTVVRPEQIGPGRWLLPRLPASDPAALRRLSCDCRELEAVLGGVASDAEWVLADLRRDWSGQAALAAPAPLLTLREDLAVVRRALEVFATELERLAGALDEAEERHGWSWRKVAMVSAVVAVTAGSVIVSVGSLGTASAGAVAADAAVVSAAAGEMAAASVAAASAEAAAVEGLLAAARLARTVEALRAIVIPRLLTAAVKTSDWIETPLGGAVVGGGTSAAIEFFEDGRVNPEDVVLGAVLGAGENIVLAPGRSRGYVELTQKRLDLMKQSGRRRDLLRIARARAPQDERPFSVPARQVKTHYKHAKVFAVSPNYSRASATELDRAMKDFVARPSTVRIDGMYKKQPAIMYTDYDSKVVVICQPDGSFWSVVEMTQKQHWHLWHDTSLGGTRR
jgi:Colicin D